MSCEIRSCAREPARDEVADDVEPLRVARHVARRSAGSRTTRGRTGRTRGSSRVSAISQQRLGPLDPEVEVVERARVRSAPASRSVSRISSADSSWRPTCTVIAAPVARCAGGGAAQHLPLLAGAAGSSRRLDDPRPDAGAVGHRLPVLVAGSPPGRARRPHRSRRSSGRRRRPRSSPATSAGCVEAT